MTPDQIYKEVGARIRDARLRLSMSQGDLASRSGFTRTSIVNLEGGKQRIPLHRLFQIASVLNVDPTMLLPTVKVARSGNLKVGPDVAKKLSDLPTSERKWIKELLQTRRGNDG